MSKKVRSLAAGASTGRVLQVGLCLALVAAVPIARAALPGWSASQVYTAGNEVQHGGKIWRAKWWTQGNDPASSGEWGVWALVAACDARCAPDGGGGGDGGGGNTPPVTGPKPKPGGGYTMTQAEIDASEAALTSSPLFTRVKASIATRSNADVLAIAPRKATNPDNVKRVERIVDETTWHYLFPLRHPSYTYSGFLQAVGKFRGFCADYDDGRNGELICRKALATAFAHFAQETGGHDPHAGVEEWRQALVYVREAGCSETGSGCTYNAECAPGTWQGITWPCGKDAGGAFRKYFGRGAKQLSYNYNYGPFSQAMYGDVRTLLDKPELVADSWLNLASAIFFYVYPASPKPSMLHVMDGSWQPNAADTANGIKPGFGATTNVINGGIECGHGYEKPQSLNRIAYYRRFAQYLGVPIPANEELGCANQKRFDVQGAGALNIFWDQDWGYFPAMPEGKAFACKLVGYQTAYSALQTGDYQRCVSHYFNVEVLR